MFISQSLAIGTSLSIKQSFNPTECQTIGVLWYSLAEELTVKVFGKRDCGHSLWFTRKTYLKLILQLGFELRSKN